MPEHLKSLVIILTLATVVFALAKPHACAVAMAEKDFERRRRLWFALVLIAFLAHNFWLYMLLGAGLLLSAQRSEHNGLALYFFLLVALPGISAEIPALGVINHLFEIDFSRLLALTVLFPAYLALRRQPGVEPFGREGPDKILACYLILVFILTLDHTSLVAAIRKGIFYGFIDIFLPYYVASRGVRSLKQFRDVQMAFVVGALALSSILAYEFMKQWLLYPSLEDALGAPWGWNGSMMRDGNLRASGTAGHPIAAGYVIAIAAAFFVCLKSAVPSKGGWMLGFVLLMAGLIAPISRGPWLGAAVMILVFIATGPAPVARFAKLAAFGVLAVPLVLATPAGQTIIDHLPWIGTTDAHAVDGRAVIIAAAFDLAMDRNPFFGSSDFLETPEMQALRGSDGIIDLVSTYAILVLTSGFVGLSIFIGVFLSVAFVVYRGMRSLADQGGEPYVLGQILLATFFGILVIIGTVAPVVIIPRIYWAVAGLGVGYALMLRRGGALQPAGRTAPAQAPASRPGSPVVFPAKERLSK